MQENNKFKQIPAPAKVQFCNPSSELFQSIHLKSGWLFPCYHEAE